MKKLYFLFVLSAALLARAAQAQAQTTDPVRQKLDNIFANLDKTYFGRLLEAAEPSHYHK